MLRVSNKKSTENHCFEIPPRKGNVNESEMETARKTIAVRIKIEYAAMKGRRRPNLERQRSGIKRSST